MKISINAIADSGYDKVVAAPVPELLQKIGAQLGEVEETISLGDRFENAVVVNVVSCVKHPNADKLHVCKVDDGGVTKHVPRDDDGHVQVVCGAPNVHAGMFAIWLPPGAVVPSTYDKEQFTLSARELRGVVSNGMLASAAELGISEDHDGILEVEPNDIGHALAKPGVALKELYDLDDTIIDIENKMFTHRPDCFGQLGVARELAGIQHMAFKSPEWYLNPKSPKHVHDPSVKGLKVTNQVPELTPRYMGIVMSGIKVSPSPVWLQSYLSRLGVRPINNIVDMTNYMMMLTGQPLHAFDFDKVAKNGTAEIIIRNPKKGEKMGLLDGKTIEPRKEAILIADPDKIIALGGVMGGNNSEIDDNTTRIIIECANFDMYNIRRTAMEHGIFTDAVTRFNKGQSAWQCPAVLAKAVELTEQLSPSAQAASAVVDDKGKIKANPAVKVTPAFINDRLGLSLSAAEITKLLENVEFKVEKGEALAVTAPFWRTDIEIPEDVVEEVGRLYGYDHLPLTLPKRDLTPAKTNANLDFKSRVRDILSKAGANEVLTYSFVHSNLLERVGQDPKLAFQLSNALSPDLQYYRESLTPSLLDKVHGNIKAGYNRFALFEMNKVHNKLHAKGDAADKGLPVEFNMLALVFTANDKAAKLYAGAPYYEARKYMDYLGEQLGLALTYTPIKAAANYPVMKPYDLERSSLVSVTGTEIVLGVVGEFKSSVLSDLKLPAYTAGLEVGLGELQEALASFKNSYAPLAKYPKTSQDISFKLPEDVDYIEVNSVVSKALEAAAAEHGYEWILEALDIFQPTEDKTHKHVSLRVTLWHSERTLTTVEVNSLLDELAGAAKSKLKAERL